MVMCVDSGIENDVKLWEPVAAEPCNLDNLERVMQANASNQVRVRGCNACSSCSQSMDVFR